MATPDKVNPVAQAGLDSIEFSINGASREEYKQVHGRDDFQKVIENLRSVYKFRNDKRLNMGIYVSYVKNSKSKIYDSNIEHLIEPFCDNFDFREVSNQGGSMLELNESENIDKNNILGSLRASEMTSRCVYPFNRMVINPYGYVVACTADFHNQLSIADAKKKLLKKSGMEMFSNFFAESI